MLTIVTWKWNRPEYRTKFTAEHVNVMARMIGRHYAGEHEVCCVTNDSDGIDPQVRIIPDTEDFASLRSPHGGISNPSCFRRLRMFMEDAAETFGERIVSIDLDAVIVRDMAPVWDRDEDFVGWRDPMSPRQLNGSMMLLRAGSRPGVWDEFNPDSSPGKALKAGYKGSDQAWLSYCLAGEPRWTKDDGIYSFRVDVMGRVLPKDARIIFFHGNVKPWTVPEVDPVRKHWN